MEQNNDNKIKIKRLTFKRVFEELFALFVIIVFVALLVSLAIQAVNLMTDGWKFVKSFSKSSYQAIVSPEAKPSSADVYADMTTKYGFKYYKISDCAPTKNLAMGDGLDFVVTDSDGKWTSIKDPKLNTINKLEDIKQGYIIEKDWKGNYFFYLVNQDELNRILKLRGANNEK